MVIEIIHEIINKTINKTGNIVLIFTKIIDILIDNCIKLTYTNVYT